MTADLGRKVAVLGVPSLEESPPIIRRLANEHSTPTLAVFGSNVFDANYERLKEIPNLEFGVVPLSSDALNGKSLPPGTRVITVEEKSTTPLPVLGPPHPCHDLFADLGGSFPVHLPGVGGR